MTVLTLSAPGLDALTLSSADGWRVRQLDFTSGAWRSNEIDAPDADGSIDTTTLRGAGSMTLGLRLTPSAESLSRKVDRLRAFTQGRLRPTLTIDHEDGSVPRFATMSQGVVTAPLERPTHRDVAVVWKVPFGILESVELRSEVVSASGSGSAGVTFPLEFPVTFPDATPEGSTLVVNVGNADAYPLLRVYGPWSGETRVTNDATGLALVFDNESVAAGDFLEVNTRTRTIRLNGDPDQSRYSRLVFPDSVWWSLVPGEQRISFVPEVFNAPAQVVVEWRDAYL